LFNLFNSVDVELSIANSILVQKIIVKRKTFMNSAQGVTFLVKILHSTPFIFFSRPIGDHHQENIQKLKKIREDHHHHQKREKNILIFI